MIRTLRAAIGQGLIALVLGLGLLSYSQTASATCDGCVVGAVSAASSAITGAVTATQAAVVGALTMMDQHLTTAIAGSTAAITSSIFEASKNQSHVISQAIANQGYASGIQRISRDSQGFDPCLQAVPAMGMANTAVTAPARMSNYERGSGVPAQQYPTGDSALNNAIAIARGQIPAPAPQVQAQAAMQGGCSAFAAPGTPRGKQCEQAGVTPADTSGLPDADISATTLLDGPQLSLNPANRVVRTSISPNASSADEMAVSAYLRNLNTPIRLRSLKAGELNTTAGQAYVALKATYDARMSMANSPNVEQAADITASTQTLPQINQLLSTGNEAYVAWVKQFLNSANPNWQQQGISWHDLLRLEVSRRYLNPAWAANLIEDDSAEVQRSTARQLALQSYMLYQILQEQRRTSLVDSEIAMSLIRQEMGPQLIRAHALASR